MTIDHVNSLALAESTELKLDYTNQINSRNFEIVIKHSYSALTMPPKIAKLDTF